MEPRHEPILFRGLRVLLAFWWVIAPAVLGYWGTFAQRQDVIAGLLALPLMLIGLVAGGMRSFLFAIGLWLVLSPSFSGFYAAAPTAVTNDYLTGVLAMILAVVPYLFSPAASEVISADDGWRFSPRRRSLLRA